MTNGTKKRKKQILKELEEKLTLYELLLYEEALKRDGKRQKNTYIH